MNDNQVIPEAAVEAAAEWLPHSGDCEVRPERDCMCWKARVDLMRAALEAAAPHMLAAAWGEGHLMGWNEATANSLPERESLWRNPYRTTP